MKVIQGTFRKDRHGTEMAAPAAGSGGTWPKAPKHLTDRERKLWKTLKPLCESWVAPSDVLAINGVVSLYDRLIRVQEAQRESEVAGHPLAFIYKAPDRSTGDGDDAEPVALEMESRENPLFGQEIKFWRELRAYIALTGLSPVDRAKVREGGSGEPAKPSTLDGLIKRGRSK